MSCKAGKHKWKSGKGRDGERCTKCGDPYRGRGRPKLKAAARPAPAPPAKPKPAPRPVGDEAAARLAAALGSPATSVLAQLDAHAASEESMPAAPAVAENVDDVKSTCQWIARRMTKVLVGVTEWAIGLAKREPGEPDEDDEAQFAEGLGRALQERWEDRGLTPGMQMMLAGGFIVGEMCLGSEPIPQPEKPNRITTPPPLIVPTAANGAVTTGDVIPLHD